MFKKVVCILKYVLNIETCSKKVVCALIVFNIDVKKGRLYVEVILNIDVEKIREPARLKDFDEAMATCPKVQWVDWEGANTKEKQKLLSAGGVFLSSANPAEGLRGPARPPAGRSKGGG